MKTKMTDSMTKENIVTNKEYHTNGKLSYIEKLKTISKEESKNYNAYNIRVNENGEMIVRIGVNAKYYDNGQIAWMLEYDDKGNKTSAESTKYHKDGSIMKY